MEDKNKQTEHAYKKSQQGSVCPTIDKLQQDKEVEHISHMRFKKLYQHQWSYGVIQTVDH